MRQELLETLTNWKEEENKVGSRRITYSLFPDGQGEYIVRVSEELNVTFNGNNRNVSVKKSFLTQAQSENGLNLEGDIYRAKQILQNVAIEFYQSYDNAINELFLGYEGEFHEV